MLAETNHGWVVKTALQPEGRKAIDATIVGKSEDREGFQVSGKAVGLREP
jgi:hypothetical protein